jgi:4-hydroxy-tetrahydrodipicolinate synthase
MDRIKSARLMTAIKTPYNPDGSFDYDAYDRLVERQIENGVEGLIVGGTTGEGHLMNWDEQLKLTAHTAKTWGDKLVVVGNTGSNNTREAVHATKEGFAAGMHAALQINPYYGKTSTEGLLAHFNTLLELGPAFVYNVPGRTGQDIVPEVMKEIAKSPNFIASKECMGNERILQYEEQGISCWSGNDDQSFEGFHRHQSHGVISVTANVVPSLMRRLMDEDDKELNQKMQELFAWMFSEPNPIPLNTILMMMGLIQPVFRLPYVPVSKAEREKGKAILESFNAPEVGEIKVLEDSDFILVKE